MEEGEIRNRGRKEQRIKCRVEDIEKECKEGKLRL